MRRAWMLAAGIGLCFGGGFARAETPTTEPSTTQPTADFPADSPARTWFANLASSDDAKRDEARTDLMGLSRDDLPRLRALVEKNRPLAPAQAATLHEIVMQIYLAGEPYTGDSIKGFLGLQWPIEGNLYDLSPRLGVPVPRRLPGFPSNRMLHEGDLILGVLLNPDAPLEEFPNMPTRDRESLTNVIKAAGANRDVALELLREGQHIRVALRLQSRPVLLGDTPGDLDAFLLPRIQKGEDYWRQEFVPLLRAGVS